MSSKSRAAPVRGAPKYEHPTGSCSDLIPVLNAKGEAVLENGEPKRVPCGGKLEHVRSRPATGKSNPGQQEYECAECGLGYVVSNRRWDEDGNVIETPEQVEGEEES